MSEKWELDQITLAERFLTGGYAQNPAWSLAHQSDGSKVQPCVYYFWFFFHCTFYTFSSVSLITWTLLEVKCAMFVLAPAALAKWFGQISSLVPNWPCQRDEEVLRRLFSEPASARDGLQQHWGWWIVVKFTVQYCWEDNAAQRIRGLLRILRCGCWMTKWMWKSKEEKTSLGEIWSAVMGKSWSQDISVWQRIRGNRVLSKRKMLGRQVGGNTDAVMAGT